MGEAHFDHASPFLQHSLSGEVFPLALSSASRRRRRRLTFLAPSEPAQEQFNWENDALQIGAGSRAPARWNVLLRTDPATIEGNLQLGLARGWGLPGGPLAAYVKSPVPSSGVWAYPS